MKRVLLTFSGSAYEATTAITARDYKRFGADEFLCYDDVWLRAHPFHELNKWIFELPGVRGLSWFSWKPLVMMDALQRVSDGDVCCFIDGDTYPIAPLTPLYDRCVADNGVMLFAAQGCSNRQWVKADCWKVMAAFDGREGRPTVALDSPHAVARFMLFQRGHWHVQQFLMEWLTYCLNPLATTFDASVLGPEHPGFEQHRTEQAILSLLALKYNFNLYREACAFGNAALAQGVDAFYPQTFVQIGGSGKDTGKGSRFRNV